jgi:hypothetical protein
VSEPDVWPYLRAGIWRMREKRKPIEGGAAKRPDHIYPAPFRTEAECQAAIDAMLERRAEARPPGDSHLTADSYAAAIRHQLPLLTTHDTLLAYLDHPQTKNLRARLRAYPILHAEIEALIDGALAYAVDDGTDGSAPIVHEP